MTNDKNQQTNSLGKYKFLVPILVAISLICFLLNHHEGIISNLKLMVMIVGILIITIWLSVHHFRMTYDAKYKEEKNKITAEEMKKPWHRRTKNVGLSGICWIMLFIAPLICVVSVSYFFYEGFFKEIWDYKNLNGFVFFIIIFLFCYKALKKNF